MTSLKKALQQRQTTIGSWLSLSGQDSCEIMTRSGFDWLVIDMEHTALGSGRMVDLIRIVDLAGLPALVRVGANDPLLIKHALDAGARGVIVPMVNSAEEARRAVAAAYYPPVGNRGVGLFRAQGYGATFDTYREEAASETVVVVQIEHKDAVNNIEDILAVPGVDAFMIGPYDLSGSLGVPGDFNAPQYQACMAKVTKALHSSQVAGGVHIVQPDRALLQKLIAEGYSFLVYGVDEIFLGKTAAGEAEFARSLSGTK